MKQRSSLVSSRDYIDLNKYVINDQQKHHADHDRRGLKRLDLEQLILLTDRASGQQFGHALNISQSGICAIATTSFNVGTVIDMELTVKPDGSLKQLIHAAAEVQWYASLTKHSNSFKIGMHWHELNPKARIRINELIRTFSKNNKT